MKHNIKLAIILNLCLILNGCYVDPGNFINDTTLLSNLYQNLDELVLHQENNNVTFVVYKGFVLAVGQVEDQVNQKRIDAILQKNTTNFLNKTTISRTASLTQNIQDSLMTGEIKLTLSMNSLLSALEIKVITEQNQVYLLGSTSQKEHDEIISIVQKITGIQKMHDLINIKNR